MKNPQFDSDSLASDIDALIIVAQAACNFLARISIKKPTPTYDYIYGKISDKGMETLLKRYGSLLSNLRKAKLSSDEDAAEILSKEFGSDFPKELKKSNSDSTSNEVRAQISDMKESIPTFSSPAQPHAK